MTRERRFVAMACAGTVLLLGACGGGGSEDDASTDDAPVTAGETDGSGTDDPTDASDPVDQRPAVLAELGGPDSFVVSVDEVDGEPARFESWVYFDALTQIDFLDGEVLWDIQLDPVDDGTLLPLQYSPVELELLATSSDTFATLDGVDLVAVDATDFEIDGAEVWAGEQLLLAFVDDRLVYAETYALAPGEQEIEG